MKEQIRARARELGFDVCRFARADTPDSADRFQQWIEAGNHGEMAYLERNSHKRKDPQQVLAQAKTFISLAVSYHSPSALDAPQPKAGIIARYARALDYHEVIASPLKQLSDYVGSFGKPEDQSLWYTDTGPILERDIAQRAGVGFVGKHTNLISRDLGNWFFLSEILTTLALDPDPPETNRCGNCSRCIPACPTGAITAPFQLDARRCISYLTIELKGSIPVSLRPAVGNRIFGCDDCLAVCPWNRFAREGALMRASARPELDAPQLLDLLALTPEEFKRRFSGTPIVRTKRRGLLRNVCVALGNTGSVDDLPALERASRDAEELIAEHAIWAIEQIEARWKNHCSRTR